MGSAGRALACHNPCRQGWRYPTLSSQEPAPGVSLVKNSLNLIQNYLHHVRPYLSLPVPTLDPDHLQDACGKREVIDPPARTESSLNNTETKSKIIEKHTSGQDHTSPRFRDEVHGTEVGHTFPHLPSVNVSPVEDTNMKRVKKHHDKVANLLKYST